MSIFNRLAIVSLVALPFFFWLTTVRAVAAGKPGYFIQQRSAFLGQREVWMTDTAFMAINHLSGHILITKAPDWQVRVANLHSKLYFVTPFETWVGRKIAMSEKAVRGLTNQVPVHVERHRVICGLPADGFKIDSSNGLEKRFINGRREPNDFDCAEYWVTGALPFPKQARDTILTFYQLPSLSEFPLEVTYVRKGAADCKHLLTSEVRKQFVDDSHFEIPKSCRKASFETEVWMDDKTREMFEMFK